MITEGAPNSTERLAQIAALGDDSHSWQLYETGYVRTWITEFDEESKTIVAHWGGSSDFSDEGDGHMWLQCSTCLTIKPVPDGWEIDYQ